MKFWEYSTGWHSEFTTFPQVSLIALTGCNIILILMITFLPSDQKLRYTKPLIYGSVIWGIVMLVDLIRTFIPYLFYKLEFPEVTFIDVMLFTLFVIACIALPISLMIKKLQTNINALYIISSVPVFYFILRLIA
jgi:hypothetical protein